MIKGHIQIDLHNHKTGLTERIEKDNLVTNAAQTYINTMIGRGKAATNFMPLATTMYGGVMLFEDSLTENVNNIALPYDNFIVGFAGQTVNSDNPDMGSINLVESGPIEDGYMNVWDFNTSQANGVISAMSLCHSNVGALYSSEASYNPYNAEVSDGSGISTYGIADYSNNVATFINGSPQKKLYNRYIPTKDFAISDSAGLLGPAVEETMSFPSGITNEVRNGYDGYMYHAQGYSTETVAGGTKTISVLTMDRFVLGSTSKSTITIRFDENVSNTMFDNNKIAVSNGKIFIPFYNSSNSKLYIYVVPTFTNTDFYNGTGDEMKVEIEDQGIASNPTHFVYGNRNGSAILWISSNVTNRYKCINIKSDGSYKNYGGTRYVLSTPVYITQEGYKASTGYSAALSFPAGYLGTICNFSEPFEKTNTVSMKVKYTLTNVS